MCNIGILTFHCADNFGAMLQAYGLKQYLVSKKMDVEIVRYEPPFMTGRHWWIPYIPEGGLFGIIRHGWHGWRRNLKLGKTFFECYGLFMDSSLFEPAQVDSACWGIV